MSAISSSITNLQNNTALRNFQAGQDRVAQGNNELDKDAFLQLMFAQLRNQNPDDAMDPSQFLQQQASFTQIEELQNLSSAIKGNNQLMQASNLVGKSVTVADEFGGTQQLTVESVVFDDTGQVLIRNGDDIYSANSIQEIFDNSQPSGGA